MTGCSDGKEKLAYMYNAEHRVGDHEILLSFCPLSQPFPIELIQVQVTEQGLAISFDELNTVIFLQEAGEHPSWSQVLLNSRRG